MNPAVMQLDFFPLMKNRKIITCLLIALMIAYILEAERRIIRNYDQQINQVSHTIKSKLGVSPTNSESSNFPYFQAFLLFE